MAITIVTTVGSASANSYGTLVEGDAYAETTVWNASWVALTDAEKDAMLVRSTRLLDTMRHEERPTDDVQALQYPRLGIERPTGTLWPSDEIPFPILNAHLHIAAWLANKGTTTDPSLHSTNNNVKRKKLVSVVGETEWFAPPKPETDAFLRQVIAPMLEPHGLVAPAGTIQLVRG